MKDIKRRSVILLSLLLVIGFLFTSFVSYLTAHDSINSQVTTSTLPLTSDNIYSEIQRDLLRPIFISSMMAKDTFVRDWVLDGEGNEDEIIKYLKEVQEQYGAVTSFFVSDKSRKYYHSSGVLRIVEPFNKQDVWYFRVQKMSQNYEINVDTDTSDRSSLTVFINHKVYDYSGNYIGAIGVGLALNKVKELIENYNHRYGKGVYFINSDGLVMLRGGASNHIDDIHQITGLSKFSKQITSSLNSSIKYKDGNNDVFLNSRFIPEFGWYLIVVQENDEVQTRLQNTLFMNLIVSFVISIIIILLVNLIIANYQKKLETMATTDKLTGAANRHMFDVLFKQAHAQSKLSSGGSLSAIMFDLDYFKQINDTYGHPTGDVVLKKLTQTIKSMLRESDLIFRWGGEEFFLILPETDLKVAYEMAEKIREEISGLNVVFAGKNISVTISLGVACIGPNESSNELIEHADTALYLAKNNGRDRTECYQI
ncbi:sensor domain-containing diguanylate cyclase [Psychromonas algicola]|uniref:sensor domain-containing diguanylate cyclase n=1 Tax=Psychromonas algicola TaxID=2555642 RepID=UPI001067A45D|nr:sensor domain-containing diguanylate cyclase [Psychromonas sp. RZ5]TEW50215.1 GGDEF domain-containing protein [Psychromonas sp. RZ5]